MVSMMDPRYFELSYFIGLFVALLLLVSNDKHESEFSLLALQATLQKSVNCNPATRANMRERTVSLQ